MYFARDVQADAVLCLGLLVPTCRFLPLSSKGLHFGLVHQGNKFSMQGNDFIQAWQPKPSSAGKQQYQRQMR